MQSPPGAIWLWQKKFMQCVILFSHCINSFSQCENALIVCRLLDSGRGFQTARFVPRWPQGYNWHRYTRRIEEVSYCLVEKLGFWNERKRF